MSLGCGGCWTLHVVQLTQPRIMTLFFIFQFKIEEGKDMMSIKTGKLKYSSKVRYGLIKYAIL